MRDPTTGSSDCCAGAATGHAAAPPSPAMNSRRRSSPEVADRTPYRGLDCLGRASATLARVRP
jgi:hypothetical protein